jgi:hypothetical protein
MFTVRLRILYPRGINFQDIELLLFGIDPCLRSVLQSLGAISSSSSSPGTKVRLLPRALG